MEVLTQREAADFCRIKKELFAQFISDASVKPINIGARKKLFLRDDLIAGLKRIRDAAKPEAQQAQEAQLESRAAAILGEHK